MTVVDTLQVILEADSRGLEDAMRKAVAVATNTVNEINKQEVDWTSIFSRSVTPAIISGVASMFALAISQSLQFQQAMAQTGVAAGESAGQLSQMSDQALKMSTTVPASAQDIATTMTQVSAIFGTNTQATQDVTQALSELAASGFGNLNDITSVAMELFREFGVRTENDAVSVLTDLMHAAEGAKETIPELGDQFTKFSSTLPQAERTLSGINGQLSTFSSYVANIGANATQSIFGALSASAATPTGPFELLGKGVGEVNQALQTGNISGLLGDISSKVVAMGNTAKLVLPAFGFSQDQIAAFTTASKSLEQINADQTAIYNNPQSIKKAFDESDTALRQLMEDWNKLKAIMTDGAIATAVADIAKVIGAMIDELANWPQLMQQFGSNLAQFWTNPKKAIEDTGKETSLNSLLQTLVKGKGLNFNTSALSRIDQTAYSTGLIDALTSALNSGGKGDQYQSTLATFNLSLPTSASGWTPKDLANALYAKFQGTAI